jgi:hypothetical protein
MATARALFFIVHSIMNAWRSVTSVVERTTDGAKNAPPPSEAARAAANGGRTLDGAGGAGRRPRCQNL